MPSATPHDALVHPHSRSRKAGRRAAWTRCPIVTLPSGQLVMVLAPGIYQAVSSGKLSRSERRRY